MLIEGDDASTSLFKQYDKVYILYMPSKLSKVTHVFYSLKYSNSYL